MTDYQLPPCNIRKYVVEKYGEENACVHGDTMTWDECEGECRMAANCTECGHPRILISDPCFGRNMICVNPECSMDK